MLEKEDRQLHLDAGGAYKLLSRALKEYRNEHKTIHSKGHSLAMLSSPRESVQDNADLLLHLMARARDTVDDIGSLVRGRFTTSGFLFHLHSITPQQIQPKHQLPRFKQTKESLGRRKKDSLAPRVG